MSISMSSTDKITAERLFRESFERLKQNKPQILPIGSQVTQNNVAREAGRDSSALKKDRYPLLILEIQAYISAKTELDKVSKRVTDNRARTDKKKLADYRQQVSWLSSVVAAQNAYIEELLDEINRLNAAKVLLKR